MVNVSNEFEKYVFDELGGVSMEHIVSSVEIFQKVLGSMFEETSESVYRDVEKMQNFNVLLKNYFNDPNLRGFYWSDYKNTWFISLMIAVEDEVIESKFNEYEIFMVTNANLFSKIGGESAKTPHMKIYCKNNDPELAKTETEIEYNVIIENGVWKATVSPLTSNSVYSEHDSLFNAFNWCINN